MNSSATTQTRPIAPSYPQSSADQAAHAAASYVRPPLPVRVPESGLTATGTAALYRLERELAPVLRDRQAGDAARREIAGVA